MTSHLDEASAVKLSSAHTHTHTHRDTHACAKTEKVVNEDQTSSLRMLAGTRPLSDAHESNNNIRTVGHVRWSPAASCTLALATGTPLPEQPKLARFKKKVPKACEVHCWAR